ncbi:MAG: Ni/Fe hydrogenase subunit alpha [Candidatus Hadarchaeales archaeon]
MNGKDVEINVHHVTRVEGHGNIVVDVKNGELKEVRLDIVESPRFFEAMLSGRRFPEAVHITSRICGICAVSHTHASVRALEDALGIKPTQQTEALRRVLTAAEMLDSHALHAFMLAAPDFFNVPSVIPLASTAPEVVKMAIRMKKLAHDVCDAIAGRHTHPISIAIDGFTSLVTEEQLKSMLGKVKEMIREDVPRMIDFFAGLKFPDFERKTDYTSLTSRSEYAMYDGIIRSSETGEYKHRDYRMKISERVMDHSTAKHAMGPHRPYMVGALSRLNNNFNQLTPGAREAAERLGLRVPVHNPFKITLAQVVEIVHCLEWMSSLIEDLLATGIKDERAERPPISGWSAKLPKVNRCWGVGVTEAPRGLLVHEYRINKDGLIESANCVIPTAQNLANIEADMRELVPLIVDRPKDEIRLMLEMLVRAYDPCISCSTHMLEVKLVE